MKVVTRSINEYSLSPKEYDVYDGLVKHYEFVADEYPDAWKFKQFLKNLNYCDFSDIQDDIYFIINHRNEQVIMCKRIIFFSCRPKDMNRLGYVLQCLKLRGTASILNDQGDIEYENCV